jgi:hypothetical protein
MGAIQSIACRSRRECYGKFVICTRAPARLPVFPSTSTLLYSSRVRTAMSSTDPVCAFTRANISTVACTRKHDQHRLYFMPHLVLAVHVNSSQCSARFWKGGEFALEVERLTRAKVSFLLPRTPLCAQPCPLGPYTRHGRSTPSECPTAYVRFIPSHASATARWSCWDTVLPYGRICPERSEHHGLTIAEGSLPRFRTTRA